MSKYLFPLWSNKEDDVGEVLLVLEGYQRLGEVHDGGMREEHGGLEVLSTWHLVVDCLNGHELVLPALIPHPSPV